MYAIYSTFNRNDSKLVTINLGHERNSFLLSRWWHGLQALNLNESLLSCQAGCPREKQTVILRFCVLTHVVARVLSATCLIGRHTTVDCRFFTRWFCKWEREKIFAQDGAFSWRFLKSWRNILISTLLETIVVFDIIIRFLCFTPYFVHIIFH